MTDHEVEYEVLRRSRWFNPRARLHYAGCRCGWYDIRWTEAEVRRRVGNHLAAAGSSPYGHLRAL